MKKLSEITEEEVKTICEIYGEPFISFDVRNDKVDSLYIQIETTSTCNRDLFDSIICIYCDGRIILWRNNGTWGGSRYVDINPLIAIDYLRSLGYEFNYKIPQPLERKMKLSILEKL